MAEQNQSSQTKKKALLRNIVLCKEQMNVNLQVHQCVYAYAASYA